MGKLRLMTAVLTATVAAVWDLKTGKVSNRLVLAALTAAAALLLTETVLKAVALMAVPGETWPDVMAKTAAFMAGRFLFMTAGAVIPLLFPGILFPLGMMGGGDIKLLAALGVLLGMSAILRIIPAAFIAGACQALVLLALRRDGKERLRRLWTYIRMSVLHRRLLDYGARSDQHRQETGGAGGEGGTGTAGTQMHFTVSILAAVLWYVIPCGK